MTAAFTPGPWEIYRQPVANAGEAILELVEQVQSTAPIGDTLFLINAAGKMSGNNRMRANLGSQRPPDRVRTGLRHSRRQVPRSIRPRRSAAMRSGTVGTRRHVRCSRRQNARRAMRPRLLDLFCGAGGAAMGYHRGGFDVVGIDINPQPRYPFQFIQADALSVENFYGIDAVHASPPCQKYTRKAAHWGRERKHFTEHPDLLGPTRDMLEATGLPYVIENVMGAPMRCDLVLCGTMFGLRIIKHRQFEANFPIGGLLPECDHRDVYNPWQGKGRSAEEHRAAQGTPWIPQCGGASRKAGYTGDLNNAIPPAFTEWMGAHILHEIGLRKMREAA